MMKTAWSIIVVRTRLWVLLVQGVFCVCAFPLGIPSQNHVSFFHWVLLKYQLSIFHVVSSIIRRLSRCSCMPLPYVVILIKLPERCRSQFDSHEWIATGMSFEGQLRLCPHLRDGALLWSCFFTTYNSLWYAMLCVFVPFVCSFCFFSRYVTANIFTLQVVEW